MRIVQTSILKLLSLIVLVGSAALVAMWLDEAVYQYVRDYGKPAFHTYYGVGAAGVLFLLAVFGALPLFKERRPKSTISFPGIHGNVTIELDSVEANLGRVVSKMPEVKKIKVKVTPSEDSHRAVVSADVLMYKGPGGASARDTANRIADFLMDTAVNILGVEEVTKVDLNVRDIIVDAKRLSVPQVREPLAKHEDHPAPEERPMPGPGEAPRPQSELALGAHELEKEEKALAEGGPGFSSSIEMIPDATPEAAPAADRPSASEEDRPAGSTSFELLASEDDEDLKKEG